MIWLSSTYTKGASVIYRKVLHPLLARKERHIDKWIDQKQGQSLDYLVTAGKKGIQAAASGAMSGVAQLQGKDPNDLTATVAATGMMSTLMSTAGNFASNLTTSAPAQTSGGSGRSSRRSNRKESARVEEMSDESYEE